MSDRMIKNISKLQYALPVHVKGDVIGRDIIVQLMSGEVFWSPDDRDTKSLLVYTKKGFLESTLMDKPAEAKYYEAYPQDYWNKGEKNASLAQQDVEPAVEDKEAVKTKWEDDEVDYLKDNYPKYGVQYCSEKLGRSKQSVKKKAEALGLKRLKDDKE